MGRENRCLCATAALLLVSAVGAADPAAPARDVLSGRVLDEQGRPIAGAFVSAWTYALFELTNAATVTTQTDGDGRFTLAVPLAGARYVFWVRRTGYSSETPSVVAGIGEPVEVRLKSGPRGALSGVVGDADTGKPAPHARVVLIAEGGQCWETKADEAGRFRIDGLGESVGQGVLFAESAGRISPYQMVRGPGKGVSLALGAPGRLTGRVVDSRTRQPIAGADVLARPNFMCAFSMTTPTGADGRFTLDGVPPGEYVIDVKHPQYIQLPLRGGWDRVEAPVEPGGRGFLSLEMKRAATIAGRVLTPEGKSAANALVGTRAFWDTTTDADQYRLVRADGEGRFFMTTGRLGEDEPVIAVSPEGIGRLRPGKLAEGETVEDAVITLAGATRVRGLVRDKAGAPLPSVWVEGVSNASTDAAGRFDLGLVPRRERDVENTVVFRPPRPDRGGINSWRDDGSREPAKLPAEGERFFHPRSVAPGPAPGAQTGLDVVLDPAALLTFSGRVLDDAGKPVPRAHVILLSGNADAASLRHALHPEDAMLNSGGIDLSSRSPALCRTVADGNGRWTMRVVRETTEGLKLLMFGQGDPDAFSVGAEGPGGATALVGNIRFEEGQTRRDVDVALGNAPKAQRISGRVVDSDGAPLKDIVVQASFPVRRTKTDAEGRFAIDGSARESVTLWFRTDGWSVLSPRPEGGPAQVNLKDIADGVDDLEVVLGRNGVVTGTVRRASGKPVVVCNVTVPGVKVSVWDPAGKFRIEGCPPGGCRVLIMAPDGTRGEAWVDLKPGGEAAVEVVLPESDCIVAGRVADANGLPANNVAVDATGANFHARTIAGEDGSFTFRVPAGTYRLSSVLLHPRFGRASEPASVTVGGDTKETNTELLVPDPRDAPR